MSHPRCKQARLAAPIAAALLGVLLVPSCGLQESAAQQQESACNFPGLTLVSTSDYVCFKNPPTVNQDGTWTWPTSNPKTSNLRKGIIIIVAKQAVRRVSGVSSSNGSVKVTTTPVPLTEVVVNGDIPLQGQVRMDQVTQLPWQPLLVPPSTPPPSTPPPSTPP